MPRRKRIHCTDWSRTHPLVFGKENRSYIPEEMIQTAGDLMAMFALEQKLYTS